MTTPLDEKGHDASTQALLNAFPMADKIAAMYAEVAIRAYLSATALPDELEVVAWRWRIVPGGWHYAMEQPVFSPRTVELVEGLEPLVTLSQAHSTIAALRARIDELVAAVDAEEKTHGMPWRFWSDKSRELADKLYDANTRAEAAEAEVKRLTEELQTLRGAS